MTKMTLKKLTTCLLLTFALGGFSACFITDAKGQKQEPDIVEYSVGTFLTGVHDGSPTLVDLTWKTPGRPLWRVRVYQDGKVVIAGNRATAVEDFIPTLIAGSMNGRMFTTSLCSPETTPSGGNLAILQVTNNATDSPFWHVAIGSQGSVYFDGRALDPDAMRFWDDVGRAVFKLCSEFDK